MCPGLTFLAFLLLPKFWPSLSGYWLITGDRILLDIAIFQLLSNVLVLELLTLLVQSIINHLKEKLEFLLTKGIDGAFVSLSFRFLEFDLLFKDDTGLALYG